MKVHWKTPFKLICLVIIVAVTLTLSVRGLRKRNDSQRAAAAATEYNDNANNDKLGEAGSCGSASCQQLRNRITRLPSVCSDENCRSDYVRHWQMENVFPIPTIRHIMWKNESISEYFAGQLRSWQRIHPDWTYVLWRDQDLEPFVATHFPGLLKKFKSLPAHIMRVDMIRYLLLFKYGGIYADLDYTVVSNLDRFRRFHCVVTREPEAHSLQAYGMSWPVKRVANPAFMMSAPGHLFHFFVMLQLSVIQTNNVLEFAGPFGLTSIMEKYQGLFPIVNNVMETVYVPPSNSFYPYPGNKLNGSTMPFHKVRASDIREHCKWLISSSKPEMQQLKQVPNLIQYCTDVNILDPVTDKSQPVFAIHDLMKSGPVWDALGGNFYTQNLTHIKTVIKNVVLGTDFMLTRR